MVNEKVWISAGKTDRPVLCPDLTRQRTVVEFITEMDMNDFPTMEGHLASFLKDLSVGLGMKIFMGPVIGNDENPDTKESGPSAFIGWTTSGCQVHSWPFRHFVSIDVYSCKRYSVETILNLVKDYFNPTELVLF